MFFSCFFSELIRSALGNFSILKQKGAFLFLLFYMYFDLVSLNGYVLVGFGFAMGSQQDASLSSINVSAGGLVWVRRRNGSWWPGRTVGLHELPVKCLLPPRSGTPIKLLGREDGSM